MIHIDGLNITDFPFQNLVSIQELLSFDEISILTHCLDEAKNDILAYMVDFDSAGSRVMYAKITRDEIFEYLMGVKSLRSVLLELASEYFFFVDYTRNNEFVRTTLVHKHLFSDKYLPVEDSYHTDGLNDFYLTYLKQSYYYYSLKKNSYIIKVTPPNQTHGKTVGAKEAAMVLINTTSSIEGYIKAKAYNVMKDDFGNVNKLNRRINSTKSFLSPRISETAFHSFEVWLTIDTILFHGQDKYDTEIRKGLIEDYKNDVLDIDYTNEDDATIINEKFTEDQRKMIYGPILKLLENTDFKISISDTSRSFKLSNYKETYTIKAFKNAILPPPSVEELQLEQEKKNRIVSIILNLKEGENLTKLTKKDLNDNLLFTQEMAETVYEIPSPIVVESGYANLKRPIKCILTITESNDFQLFNENLAIYSFGSDFNIVVSDIKRQFLDLVQNLETIDKSDPNRAKEVRNILA